MNATATLPNPIDEQTLDPENWDALRQLGHQMLDDMLDYLQNIRNEPAWRPVPEEAKRFFDNDLPLSPNQPEIIYQDFQRYVLPYPIGNIHPRFWGWVMGGGTPFGMLAEMLAAGMNPNVGIGGQSAAYLEQQVLKWCKQMLGYPSGASGLLVSGASAANLTALIVARNHHTSNSVRKDGLQNRAKPLVLYCSAETHSCIQKAAEIIGLGAAGVRKISVDENFRILPDELEQAIEHDLAEGRQPFCVVGNAGTVNTGATDPLSVLQEICLKYQLWFHVDGAFGALAKLLPEFGDTLHAIETADSVAFDLHKWLYMPYGVGSVLVKNAEAHREAFANAAHYLHQFERGAAAGPDAPGNYGIELSCEFRGLKVWMSLREHGIEKYAALIRQNIEQATYLAQLVEEHPMLELLAPTELNIVCYRFAHPNLDSAVLNELNREILLRLQEGGVAVPSSTVLGNRFAIRVAISNHRSRVEDFDALVEHTVRLGLAISGAMTT